MLSQDTYESQYHFSASRKLGFILFLIVLISLPLTLNLVRSRVSTQEYSAAKCIVRPTCLDTEPKCKLPEPENGWCPKALPSGEALLTPVSSTPQASATTTTSPTPAEDTVVCGECLAHNQKYLCTNQKTNKKFCFAIPITGPGYSCSICQ